MGGAAPSLARRGRHPRDAASSQKGAYEIDIRFVQHPPGYLHGGEVRAQHTGFELKYKGPDTDFHLRAISPTRLFHQFKHGPLSVAGLSGAAGGFLRKRYASSLRDIRRIYQRAFKALLFVHRFELSAWRHAGEDSELGYMLSEGARFSGWSYYRNGPTFVSHRADFDFNFLPVGDPYFTPAGDARAHPMHKRVAALFDWWERIFNYVEVRRAVHARCGRRLWLLWLEAREQKSADPAILLRHMGADAEHWPLDLKFFQDRSRRRRFITSRTSIWRMIGGQCACGMPIFGFDVSGSISRSRPSPRRAPTFGHRTIRAEAFRRKPDGERQSSEVPLRRRFRQWRTSRYDDVRKLDDGLRERGRDALMCYLCGPKGIAKSPEELSGILLMDVLSGRRETASRIEEAISAVQTFVRRSRIGLEPQWKVSGNFIELWDCRFISYRIWQACKRRELYKENWIDLEELKKSKKIEAFEFLDEQLKRATLTIAEPGGVDFGPIIFRRPIPRCVCCNGAIPPKCACCRSRARGWIFSPLQSATLAPPGSRWRRS